MEDFEENPPEEIENVVSIISTTIGGGESDIQSIDSALKSSIQRESLKMAKTERADLDGNPIKALTICMIGAGCFIGSHLCEALLSETNHTIVAVDVHNSDKIKHLLEPPQDRIQFHRHDMKNDSCLEGLMKFSDLVINLAAICCPPDYNTRPVDVIHRNFVHELPVVKFCSDNKKRLIHFSSCEIFGKTISSVLPYVDLLRDEQNFFVLKEDVSPCVNGPIGDPRWSFACAKQLIERLIYAEGVENGLEFTIVRPFNWIGPRMDFSPRIDEPNEDEPCVLTRFTNNLLKKEPLKLVNGGESKRTFVYIKDAIEAVVLMIENPARANGHIFNVGNPSNEISVRQLAEMMIQVYSEVSEEAPLEVPTIDFSSKEFYGEVFADSDRCIPDITLINKLLGWSPKTLLLDLLHSTLAYRHNTLTNDSVLKTPEPTKPPNEVFLNMIIPCCNCRDYNNGDLSLKKFVQSHCFYCSSFEKCKEELLKHNDKAHAGMVVCPACCNVKGEADSHNLVVPPSLLLRFNHPLISRDMKIYWCGLDKADDEYRKHFWLMCIACKKEFETFELQESHMKDCHKNCYMCCICKNPLFEKPNTLNSVHAIIEPPPHDLSFVSRNCGQSYKYKYTVHIDALDNADTSCVSFDILPNMRHKLYSAPGLYLVGSINEYPGRNYIGIFKLITLSSRDINTQVYYIVDGGNRVNSIRCLPQRPNICSTVGDCSSIGDQDALVKIWDVAEEIQFLIDREERNSDEFFRYYLRPEVVLDGHRADILCQDWSRVEVGKLLSGGCDKKIILSEPTNDSWVMNPHPFVVGSSVMAVQWSPSDGNLFASSSHDGFISVWDTRMRKKSASLQIVKGDHVGCLSWNRLCTNLIATGASQGSVYVHDIRKFEECFARNDYHHCDPITHLEWAPYDRYTLSISSYKGEQTLWTVLKKYVDEGGVMLSDQPVFMRQSDAGLFEIHWDRWSKRLMVDSNMEDGFNVFSPS